MIGGPHETQEWHQLAADPGLANLLFIRPLLTAACLLRQPALDEGGTQGAMRRVWPAVTEKGGANRPIFGRVDGLLFVDRMGVGFGCRDQSGADHHALRSERESGDEAPRIGNATGRYDWNRRHRVHNTWHQRQRRDLSGDVTSGFHALSDNSIDTRTSRPFGIGYRADLIDHLHPGGIGSPDNRGWITPEGQEGPEPAPRDTHR